MSYERGTSKVDSRAELSDMEMGIMIFQGFSEALSDGVILSGRLARKGIKKVRQRVAIEMSVREFRAELNDLPTAEAPKSGT